MTENVCNLLDDYLDGVLDPASSDRFVEHLSACRACRESVRFEQELQRSAQAADARVVLPSALVDRTRKTIRRAERRRRLQWSVGAAAMLVAGTLIVDQIRKRGPEPEPARIAEQAVAPLDSVLALTASSGNGESEGAPSAGRSSPDSAIVRIRTPERSRHIAVPRATENDNVTLVMLMPKLSVRNPSGMDDDSQQPDDTLLP